MYSPCVQYEASVGELAGLGVEMMRKEYQREDERGGTISQMGRGKSSH